MENEFKQINHSQWIEQYKPTHENVKNEVPSGTTASYVWTEIGCDGHYTIASGYHAVNRIGYWITENPHDFLTDVIDD